MRTTPEVAVTLTAPLYERLAAEAAALDVSLEWLVAALVADTLEAPAQALARP